MYLRKAGLYLLLSILGRNRSGPLPDKILHSVSIIHGGGRSPPVLVWAGQIHRELDTDMVGIIACGIPSLLWDLPIRDRFHDFKPLSMVHVWWFTDHDVLLGDSISQSQLFRRLSEVLDPGWLGPRPYEERGFKQLARVPNPGSIPE